MTTLPAPSSDQAFWTISALEAGKIVLPEKLYVTDFDPTVSRKCPSLAFLLTHSVSGKTLVFDLGIRKDAASYPPAVQHCIRTFFELDVQQDVADSLRAGGLDPGAVDYVLISHLHFDHVGDPRPFSRATILLGAGGQALLEDGYRVNQSALFGERTQFLDIPAVGAPLGPFAHALDNFRYLCIVEHVAGHVNVLARTESASGFPGRRLRFRWPSPIWRRRILSPPRHPD